jgi:hypothetical protein
MNNIKTIIISGLLITSSVASGISVAFAQEFSDQPHIERQDEPEVVSEAPNEKAETVLVLQVPELAQQNLAPTITPEVYRENEEIRPTNYPDSYSSPEPEVTRTNPIIFPPTTSPDKPQPVPITDRKNISEVKKEKGQSPNIVPTKPITSTEDEGRDRLVPVEQRFVPETINYFREARRVSEEDPRNFEKRKQYLLSIINALVDQSEILKRRVINSSLITGEIELSIIAELDADIAKLVEFEKKTEATTSLEELKRIATALREYQLGTAKNKIKKLMIIAQIQIFENHFLQNTIDQTERIEAKISDLETKGIDVARIEIVVDGVKQKIRSLQAFLEKTKNRILMSEVTNLEISEIRKIIEQVKNEIKEVNETLRVIIKVIQNL